MITSSPSRKSLLGSWQAAVRPRSGVVAGAAAVGRRFARRYLVFLLILLIPVALTAWTFLYPFAAMTYLPDSLSRALLFHGDSSAPRPAGSTFVTANDSSNQTRVLLVSAYFPLPKSKHSWLQYYTWLSHYLSNIESDLYLFAPTHIDDVMLKLRGPLPLYLNTTYQSAHEIAPLAHLQKEFAAQYALDPEKYKHNSELYQIWAAKPFFVREAIRNLRLDGKEYDLVLWVDAGTMREPHAYRMWPDTERLAQLWNDGERLTGTDRNDLVLIPLAENIPARFATHTEADGPLDSSYDSHDVNNSEGSFIGGSPDAMEWFLDAYFTYMNHWMRAGLFVGKDQSLFNTMFLLFPERFITIWNRDPRANTSAIDPKEGGHGYCGDPWSYYFFVLASPEEQEAMNKKWQSKWRLDFWNSARDRCTTAGVLAMRDVLQLSFGDSWTPPPRTLTLQHVP